MIGITFGIVKKVTVLTLLIEGRTDSGVCFNAVTLSLCGPHKLMDIKKIAPLSKK